MSHVFNITGEEKIVPQVPIQIGKHSFWPLLFHKEWKAFNNKYLLFFRKPEFPRGDMTFDDMIMYFHRMFKLTREEVSQQFFFLFEKSIALP